MARPPAATISSRVWLSEPWYLGSGSIVRAVSATVAPRAASRAAIALPSPRLLPVTRATIPSHRGSAFIVGLLRTPDYRAARAERWATWPKLWEPCRFGHSSRRGAVPNVLVMSTVPGLADTTVAQAAL